MQGKKDQPMRRLTIRLPANHPVFDLPQRDRSRIVRNWLNQGRDITLSLDTIIREIRNMQLHLKPENAQPVPDVEPAESQKPKIDVNEFLKAFD